MAIAELNRAPARTMTFEQFLDWGDEDTYAEWVDGEVVEMSPVMVLHARVVGFLQYLIQDFVTVHGLGEVFTEPYLMRLSGLRRGRMPDVLFVSNGNRHRITARYLDGPADLVVEVVSRESRHRDRGEKYREYEAAGIQEYWLIDPELKQAEFFVLDERGLYGPAPIDSEGVFRSAVLTGLWIEPKWLLQDPLPNVREITRRWDEATTPKP